MLMLQGFVVVLSGYVGFAARREGASFQRALLGGALSAAVSSRSLPAARFGLKVSPGLAASSWR